MTGQFRSHMCIDILEEPRNHVHIIWREQGVVKDEKIMPLVAHI